VEDGPFAKSEPGYCGNDGRFAKFETMEQGIQAHMHLLWKYARDHGINTLAGVVNRWAPPSGENRHNADYIDHLVKQVGIAYDAKIDLTNQALQRRVSLAMGEFENGKSCLSWPGIFEWKGHYVDA